MYIAIAVERCDVERFGQRVEHDAIHEDPRTRMGVNPGRFRRGERETVSRLLAIVRLASSTLHAVPGTVNGF